MRVLVASCRWICAVFTEINVSGSNINPNNKPNLDTFEAARYVHQIHLNIVVKRHCYAPKQLDI